jgi:hypothetical protein
MLDSAGKAVKARAQAERYVSKALRDLRQIGKLSRHGFSEEEVTQIFTAIRNELDSVQGMFKPPAAPAQPEFRFEQ